MAKYSRFGKKNVTKSILMVSRCENRVDFFENNQQQLIDSISNGSFCILPKKLFTGQNRQRQLQFHMIVTTSIEVVTSNVEIVLDEFLNRSWHSASF